MTDFTDLLSKSFWDSSEVSALAGRGIPQYEGDLSELPSGAVLFGSSGSSGVVKWVVHTRKSLLASAQAVNAHLAVTAKDVFGLALPYYHVGGFGVLARAYAAAATCVFYEGKWSARRMTQFLEREAVTITSLVPTQVYDLVDAELRAPASLRVVVVGGGALNIEAGQRARELGWPVLQSYGMSEAASQVATDSLVALTQPYQAERLPILPLWQVAQDKEQRLVLKGEALCAGILYPDRYEPHQSFVTEDVVALEDGYLRFIGRKDRTVKVKGELVNLDAIEAQLSQALMAPVLIMAQVHEREGMSLSAFGLVPAELEELNKLLPPYLKLTKYTQLEAFPKSALGKIDRRALSRF